MIFLWMGFERADRQLLDAGRGSVGWSSGAGGHVEAGIRSCWTWRAAMARTTWR